MRRPHYYYNTVYQVIYNKHTRALIVLFTLSFWATSRILPLILGAPIGWAWLHQHSRTLTVNPQLFCAEQQTSYALNILQKMPAVSFASRTWAYALCLSGNQASARATWEKIYHRDPNNPITALYFTLISFATGRYVDTIFDGEIGAYATRQGQMATEKGHPKTAAAWYQFALTLHPNTFAADRLVELASKQHYTQDSQMLEYLLTQLPTNTVEYWWIKARSAAVEEDWGQAAHAYEKAARLASPADAYTYWLHAGDTWRQAENFAAAHQAYMRAIALNSERVEAYLRLGYMYRNLGKYSVAREWYQKAIAISPDNYAPWHNLGLTARAQKKYKEALSYFERALTLNPKWTWGWAEKAITLDLLNRRKEGLSALNQAITLHPKPPKNWLQLRARWQKYPNRKSDPNYWWERGRFQEQRRLWRTAARFYHQGAQVAKPPDDYRLLLREALMWRHLRQQEQSQRIYLDLVARYPERMDPYIGLGDLARGTRDWKQAMGWYRRALTVAPQHAAPWYYMAITAYSAGQYQAALEYVERALEYQPKNPWYLYYKAATLKALGQSQKALTTLEMAISNHKNPPSGWINTLKTWRQNLR